MHKVQRKGRFDSYSNLFIKNKSITLNPKVMLLFISQTFCHEKVCTKKFSSSFSTSRFSGQFIR